MSVDEGSCVMFCKMKLLSTLAFLAMIAFIAAAAVVASGPRVPSAGCGERSVADRVRRPVAEG